MFSALNVGQAIAAARKQLGLTAKALADELDISRQMMSEIECGKTNIPLHFYVRICQQLGIDAGIFLNEILGRRAPSFANESYDNESMAKLSYHHALLVQGALETIPEDSTDIFWLGTVFRHRKPFQVQLRITGEADQMVDES